MSLDEDDHIPVIDQRVFGAGISKRKIAFVPAGDKTLPENVTAPPSSRVSDLYLSIVMDGQKGATKEEPVETGADDRAELCPTCGQPLFDGHATSIAHQFNVPHSHPPSHLDRDRMGLKYLETYGWDADGRRGLGKRPDSIATPLKVTSKNDTAGLGLMHKAQDQSNGRTKTNKHDTAANTKIVGAGQVRKLEHEKWKRGQRLHQELYGRDLSGYLGPDG